jgi:1-acyl-sn-glycerol-3-phosphate acyltransferase/ribosomal protein S27E
MGKQKSIEKQQKTDSKISSKQSNRRTRPKYKIPTRFSYGFWRIFVTVWARLLNISPDKESIIQMNNIEGPVLALGAHVNGIDFAGMMATLKNKRIAFVVSASLFYEKFISGFVRFLGNIIPKKQFSADFECIKAMKFFIDNGISIGIYPEGRVSIDGKSGDVADSTIKLIKYLGVPVVFSYTPGGYLQRPRYANKMRKGNRLYSYSKLILSKEQVQQMEISEIREVVREAFCYNEMEYQEKHQLSFIPKSRKVSLTYGLDFLLHQCPKCLAECSMDATSGPEMRCKKCGNTISIDSFGHISPVKDGDLCYDRIDKWYAFQRESLLKKIEDSENYSRSTKVDLLINDESKFAFEKVDSGILTIDKNGFCFEGDVFQGLTISIKESPYITVRLGKHIDFFVDYRIYRFIFEEKGEPAGFNLAAELLHKKYHRIEKL